MKLPCCHGIENEAPRQLPSASNDINGNNSIDGANNCGGFYGPGETFCGCGDRGRTWARDFLWALGRIPSFANIQNLCKSLLIIPISFTGTSADEPKTRSPLELVTHPHFPNPTFTDLLNMS